MAQNPSQPNIMTDNNNFTDERDLKPHLFPEDDAKKGGRVNDEGLPKKFITPELIGKQIKDEFKAKRDAIGGAVVWARFVDDPEILKSEDRKALKNYLDELLEGLEKRYGVAGFPSAMELDRLTAAVTRLGELIGVKKKDFGDLLSTMNRIENRWSKTPLIEFADKLCDRLLKVPVSPASVVSKAREKCPASEKTQSQLLREVELILTGAANHDAKEFPWEKAYAAVEGLKFADRNAGTPDLMASNVLDSKQKRHMGYLVLMDLRRQQLDWCEKFGNKIRPALNWIYLLQRDEDYKRLAQVFSIQALSPQETNEGLEILANRDRRNRNYRNQTNAEKTSKKAKKQKPSKN